jgi:hypothetical protein
VLSGLDMFDIDYALFFLGGIVADEPATDQK